MVVFLFLPFLATVDHSGVEVVGTMGGGALGDWVLGSLAGFELFSSVGEGYGIGVGVSGREAVARSSLTSSLRASIRAVRVLIAAV